VEAPTLRPLGVGDIVDRVFAMYRAKPVLFLIVAAIPYLVFVILIAVVTAVLAVTYLTRAVAGNPFDLLANPDPATLAGVIIGALGLVLAIAIIALVVFSAQSAGLVAAFGARYLGREIAVGDALRIGLRAAPRVIGAGILVFLLVAAVWAVGIFIAAVAQNTLVVVVVLLAAFIAMVYVFASTVVMPIVATLEGAGPMLALRRAWELSGGNRWRIIGLELLLIVLNLVLSILAGILLILVPGSNPTATTIVQQIANLVVSIAWTPVQWGVFTVLYYDLRVRREALDLQLAAEALPRAP
jgi:hypothetical protein